jgi:hypothetical protein
MLRHISKLSHSEEDGVKYYAVKMFKYVDNSLIITVNYRKEKLNIPSQKLITLVQTNMRQHQNTKSR